MRRDDQPILSGINWRILKGEHWALLGANGSGKTSLLKVIAGYEWPTDGSVEVLGERFGQTDLRDLRKHIGWVSSALLHWFPEHETALRIVASGIEASIGLWREFSEEEFHRAESALRALGGESILKKPYRVLSQGERQRVLIARALVNQPALMVLDESCGGLDPFARERFLHDLANFSETPNCPTFIFVTHHIEEIPTFVEYAMLLKSGQSLARGPLDQVCTRGHLSNAFGFPCDLQRENGRFRLRILDPNSTPSPGTEDSRPAKNNPRHPVVDPR